MVRFLTAHLKYICKMCQIHQSHEFHYVVQHFHKQRDINHWNWNSSVFSYIHSTQIPLSSGCTMSLTAKYCAGQTKSVFSFEGDPRQHFVTGYGHCDRQWAIDFLICTMPHPIVLPLPGCSCGQLCVVLMNNVNDILPGVDANVSVVWATQEAMLCMCCFFVQMAELSIHSVEHTFH